MKFEEALKYLREGRTIRRQAWNGLRGFNTRTEAVNNLSIDSVLADDWIVEDLKKDLNILTEVLQRMTNGGYCLEDEDDNRIVDLVVTKNGTLHGTIELDQENGTWTLR